MPHPLTYVVEDVRTALDNDPAARDPVAVLLTYPGLHAVWAYRVTHALWERGFCLTARVLAHLARLLTGVEIHPGATLGRRVFIDHGAGVVIGETATVGDDVTMYHGVTLGGDDPRPVKRHPTVRDGATLGANATLVGAITVGTGGAVGAGAVVVDDVPAGATVVGNPATVVDDPGDRADAGRPDREAGRDPAEPRPDADPAAPETPTAGASAPSGADAGAATGPSLRSRLLPSC